MLAIAEMTNAEKYLHQKELNRLRQKKFYDANKSRVLEAKIQKRALTKPPAQETASDLEQNASFLDKYKSSMNNIAPASKDKHIKDLETFINFSDCNDVYKCIKKPKEIINLIETSTQKNGRLPYSTNTKIGFVVAILKAIDELDLQLPKGTKAKYNDYRKTLEIKSVGEHAAKQQTEKVEDIDIYLEKVKQKFGELSRENVISQLYNEATVRDDFYLKVIKSARENTDKNDNYIVVPANKKSNLKVIINSFKTEKGYDVLEFDLTANLSSLIRRFIDANKIEYNSRLFGVPKKFTDYISKMNKKIGYPGSITKFRQMRIAKVLSDINVTPEIRVKLANSMGHSPAIQMKYLRNTYLKDYIV